MILGIIIGLLSGVLLTLLVMSFLLWLNQQKIQKALPNIASAAKNPGSFFLKTPFHFGYLSTLSLKVKELYKAAEIIAGTSSTILIEGESGTGKECMARALHEMSPRAKAPFIPINIAALPESLLESELFGHEKGSFTGAASQRKGRFEEAHGGTLFLDEIGELSPPLQVKLLRFIQERTIERVGGNQPIPVDVRIIVATNQDLASLIRDKKFREDLYYRLNVVNLRLIPLRERKEDLPLLCDELVGKHAGCHHKKITGYTDAFLQKLKRYSFPGNIRELENMIERAIIFSNSSVLGDELVSLKQGMEIPEAAPHTALRDLSQFEKKIDLGAILDAYRQTHGNKAKAARLVNLPESTFRYHLRKALELEL